MSEHNADKKPVNYDELFPGRFLKAGLLGGREVTLRIAAVDVEALPQDNGKERKRGVITFERTEMQLVLNTTNGQCLRAMFGTHLPDWIGKRITLKPDRDRFGRDMVDCIRISGSPDITAPVTFDLSLPRKKPRPVTLVVTGQKPATREPGQEG